MKCTQVLLSASIILSLGANALAMDAGQIAVPEAATESASDIRTKIAQQLEEIKCIIVSLYDYVQQASSLENQALLIRELTVIKDSLEAVSFERLMQLSDAQLSDLFDANEALVKHLANHIGNDINQLCTFDAQAMRGAADSALSLHERSDNLQTLIEQVKQSVQQLNVSKIAQLIKDWYIDKAAQYVLPCAAALGLWAGYTQLRNVQTANIGFLSQKLWKYFVACGIYWLYMTKQKTIDAIDNPWLNWMKSWIGSPKERYYIADITPGDDLVAAEKWALEQHELFEKGEIYFDVRLNSARIPEHFFLSNYGIDLNEKTLIEIPIGLFVGLQIKKDVEDLSKWIWS